MENLNLASTSDGVRAALAAASNSMQFCSGSLDALCDDDDALDESQVALGLLEASRTLARQAHELQAACLAWLLDAGVSQAVLGFDS